MTHVFKKAVLFAAVVSSVGASAGVFAKLDAAQRNILTTKTTAGKVSGAAVAFAHFALHGAVPAYKNGPKAGAKGLVAGVNPMEFRFNPKAREFAAETKDVLVVIDPTTYLATTTEAEANLANLCEARGLVYVDSTTKVEVAKVKDEAALKSLEVAPTFVAKSYVDETAALTGDALKEAKDKHAAAQKAEKETDDKAVAEGKKAVADAKALNAVIAKAKVESFTVKGKKAVSQRDAVTKLGYAQGLSTALTYVYVFGVLANDVIRKQVSKA